MDSRKLQSLIKREEGVKLDFKLKLSLQFESNKKELAKDVCAIANSNGGRGYIIVGIEDKSKRIIGIDEKDIIREEQIQQIISSRCEPPIPISVDVCKVYNKNICVITIYSGDQKPYQIRESGAFYIRRGSTTDTMRKQELIEAFQENIDFFMETSIILRSDISFLNKNLLGKYFKNKGIELNSENKEFLLESSRIAYKESEGERMSCTLGGLLIFSDQNSIWVPQNMIRIINKVNKDEEEVIIIQGNILDMVDKSERVIKGILPEDYPCFAIIEGIKNAVLYREYSAIDKIIEVNIRCNYISITSPGALIEKDNFNKEANHSKRNIWIYEKLITLDNNKRFLNNGGGFFRMKKAFYNLGKVKFINCIEDNYFKVILPGTNICGNKDR